MTEGGSILMLALAVRLLRGGGVLRNGARPHEAFSGGRGGGIGPVHVLVVVGSHISSLTRLHSVAARECWVKQLSVRVLAHRGRQHKSVVLIYTYTRSLRVSSSCFRQKQFPFCVHARTHTRTHHRRITPKKKGQSSV